MVPHIDFDSGTRTKVFGKVKRLSLIVAVALSSGLWVMAGVPDDYDYNRANSLITDAQYEIRQAKSYRSEAEGYLRDAKRYQSEAESQSRRGNTGSASDYSRRARNAMDKNVDCLNRARAADKRAAEKLRSAAHILE